MRTTKSFNDLSRSIAAFTVSFGLVSALTPSSAKDAVVPGPGASASSAGASVDALAPARSSAADVDEALEAPLERFAFLDTAAVLDAAPAGGGGGAARASGVEKEGRDDSYTVVLNQDSFFGFYPTFNGLIPVGKKVDLSFYGILWTRPSFGLNATNSGDDLWTEFGVGANFHMLDGRLTVKPQLGLTNGALLSGGARDDSGNVTGANFADGFVPSLTANYRDDKFEAEWYSGYYAALRGRNDDAALDFLHMWLNAGFRATEKFSFGGHYELLQNSRNTVPGGATGVTYEWAGAYVQFALPKGFFARFTGGAEISEDSSGDFYKLAAGFSF